MHSVCLDHPADFDAWRNHARSLLGADVPPEGIVWRDADNPEDLFAVRTDRHAPPAAGGVEMRVPRRFVELARDAICHSDRQRLALLYRVLWRIRHEDTALMSVASDPDVHRLHELAKSVRRDSHKMKAFVRFRSVGDSAGETFLAWFEPDHHIVERTAPFFARRFTGMRWSILTPRRSAHWDGTELTYTSGASRTDVPDSDTLEEYWRSYYASIFNPARVKLKAMQAEMPKKYWKNLPEAPLISELTRSAPERAGTMLSAGGTDRSQKGRIDLPDRHAVPLPGLADAENLDELRTACRACRACALCGPATQAVFGEGPARAALMIVGEQPGDLEDLQGRPFVGPAGELLDQLCEETGISRDETYLTNAVKHFGFERRGKRRMHKTAKTADADECLPWLEKEIAFVKPRVILAMGRTAGRALFGPSVRVTRDRGRLMLTRQGPAGVLSFHPAYILRQSDRRSALEARTALASDLRTALHACEEVPARIA